MPEEFIVKHCAPTLAGMKTGNLFTCAYESEDEIRKDVRLLNRMLVPKGLRILPLSCAKHRALIYLYRPARLKQDLMNCRACALLKSRGYPGEDAGRCIGQVADKWRSGPEWPQEIGLFLGYPPEDVLGFIQNKADHYKYSGYWKVYGDEKKAQKLFAKYKKCTEVYYTQWSKGIPIERLTVAV